MRTGVVPRPTAQGCENCTLKPTLAWPGEFKVKITDVPGYGSAHTTATAVVLTATAVAVGPNRAQ